jgi:hypothetical protein
MQNYPSIPENKMGHFHKYSIKETMKNTKLFKDTQIKTAFRALNTIRSMLKQHSHADKYNKSGIYQTICLETAHQNT